MLFATNSPSPAAAVAGDHIVPPPGGSAAATTPCPSAKIVVIGESFVGKSAVAWRFCRGEFQAQLEATVGAAFMWRVGDVAPQPPGAAAGGAGSTSPAGVACRLKYEIWDTAGQERYRSLVPVYYRGAAGAVVMYDLTNRDSFEKSKVWVRELQRHSHAGNEIHMILVGNKLDLAAQQRQVSAEEGREAARALGLAGFFETSAKENRNIEDAFQFLGSLVYADLMAAAADGAADGAAVDVHNAAVRLDSTGSNGQGWGCGCS